MATIAAVSASTPPRWPTTSTSSAAAASTGSPAWMYASTACEAESIHHLHRRRDDAGGDDVADGRGAGLDVVEIEQHRAHDRRILREAHADRRGDAAHPLAADERPAQVVTGRFGILAAEHCHGPVGQDDLEGDDVARGHTLGETVRPAGVVGDVASDRARLLAARIGSEVQMMAGDGATEVEVEHTGLDPGPTCIAGRPSGCGSSS